MILPTWLDRLYSLETASKGLNAKGFGMHTELELKTTKMTQEAMSVWTQIWKK